MGETAGREREWARFFTLAGAWNLAVGASFLVFEPQIRALTGMRAEYDPFISRLFFLFVILLGWGYWRVGRDQGRNHDVLRIGALAKLLVLVLGLAHARAGTLPWVMVTPGLVDAWFASWFVRFLVERDEAGAAA